MPLSIAQCHAVRTSLSVCLASSITLPHLSQLFCDEVKPLLPSASVMAILSAGGSLEETVMLSMQGFLGALSALLNAVAFRWMTGSEQVPTDSWISVMVVVEASLFVAVICMLPLAENIKIWIVQMTAYFMLQLFASNDLPLLLSSYIFVLSFGAVCTVTMYMAPLPGLADARAQCEAEVAFQDVADGCAEVIAEATAAFLGSGAGEVWATVTTSRLVALSEHMAEARKVMEYHSWSQAVLLRGLARDDQVAAAVQKVHREAAFTAASNAIDSCRLICELVRDSNANLSRVEAVVVRGAAAMRLVRVAEGAAALLRDFARTNFQQATGVSSNAFVDERRRSLRHNARVALENSTTAAQELYRDGNRSEMATFLFLIHSLAADVLQSEVDALRAAKAAVATLAHDLPLETNEETDSENDEPSDEIGRPSACNKNSDLQRSTNFSDAMKTPLISRTPKRLRPNHFAIEPSREYRQSLHNMCKYLQEGLQRCFNNVATRVHSMRKQMWAAVQLRQSIALKVSLSFMPAFAATIYMENRDSTFVCALATLCSYGSQYTEGSFRRSMSRGIGVAAGATVGSVVQKVDWSLYDGYLGTSIWGYALIKVVVLACIGSWTYVSILISFSGGPHSYAGLCAAFSAIKCMLSPMVSNEEGAYESVGETVQYNMHACLLVVVVEMGVFPVRAGSLLRTRLVAVLAGTAAALSALVTTSTEGLQEPFTPKIASEALRDACNTDILKLPDLTDILKKNGMYDKYLDFREGYMKWRKGEGKGAKGELKDTAEEEKPVAHTQTGPAFVACGMRRIASAQFTASSGTFPVCESESESESEPEAGEQVEHFSQDDKSVGQTPPIRFTTPAGQLSPSSQLNQLEEEAREEVRPQIKFMNAGPPILGPTCATPSAPTSQRKGTKDILLTAQNPAFAKAVAQEEAELTETRKENLNDIANGASKKEELATLDPEAAAQLPQLAKLLCSSSGSLIDLDKDEEQVVKSTADLGRSESTEADRAAENVSSGRLQRVRAAKVVSLSDVQELLDEIGEALGPTVDLSAQAAEPFDGETVDAHAWRSLADALSLVRLRLSLLARITLRLGHGVCVAEVIGGPEQTAAAETLVAAFGKALAAATSAVAGAAIPSPQACAQIEAQLHSSSRGLALALARRPSQGMSASVNAGCRKGCKASVPRDVAWIAADVLVGTAGQTLIALLSDAATLLTLSVVLAARPIGRRNSSKEHIGYLSDLSSLRNSPSKCSSKSDPSDHPSESPDVSGSMDSNLPDLVERLKQAGMYEYNREYMAWRSGEGRGATTMGQAENIPATTSKWWTFLSSKSSFEGMPRAGSVGELSEKRSVFDSNQSLVGA